MENSAAECSDSSSSQMGKKKPDHATIMLAKQFFNINVPWKKKPVEEPEKITQIIVRALERAGGNWINLRKDVVRVSRSQPRKKCLLGEGGNGCIDFHNSTKKQHSEEQLARVSEGLMNPIGRLRDQSREGCSQSVKKLALEINQSSKVVPSKVGNANTRRSQGGSRLMNPIGGSRVERCSPSVKKQDLKTDLGSIFGRKSGC
ncbi:hypothetical protein OROMI_008210 [Orobanche minor]